MTGVLMAVPPVDFVLHNSLFLVAHFHNVIIGGVLFGAFAGYTYWFPKAFGFRLHEGLGKAAFWFWIVGFYVAGGRQRGFLLTSRGFTTVDFPVQGVRATVANGINARGEIVGQYTAPVHDLARHGSAARDVAIAGKSC
jgi:hypothetical protein